LFVISKKFNAKVVEESWEPFLDIF